MIKPRPPHQAADKFLRLAKAAAVLGMDFEDAIVGVDHELIASIGPALPRLSSALQTLSQDMRRQAMTPPPAPEPAPKPTPILDLCGVLETAGPDDEKKASNPGEPPDEKKACDEPPLTQVEATRDTYAAFAGRNPLFTLEACNEAEAIREVARVFPDRGFRFQAVTPQWAAERKLPCFQHWKEATIKGLQASMSPGQLCDGYGVPQVNADGSPLKACDLHRADEAHPKVPAPAKRPKPAAKPTPAVTIEAPASADLEDPATYLAIGWAKGKPRFWLAGRDEAHVDALAALRFPEGLGGVELVRRELGVVPAFRESFPDLAHLNDLEDSHLESFWTPAPRTLVAVHRPTARRLFTIVAGDTDEARDCIGMGLTNDQLDEIDLFDDEDVSALGLPDWEEFELDLWPDEDAVSGPPAPVSGPADPEVRTYPTAAPRDPLATLPVEELGLRKPVLELVKSKGVTLAGQLLDELDVEPLDSLLSDEQEKHIRQRVLRWEGERASRMVADGSWLDEELTYAAFRVGDAPGFWATLRASGATDAELRDAINKRFFMMGGVDTTYRAGYYFCPGPAPEFFMGGKKPGRGVEPAISGQDLLDAVRRLLAIPTREVPAKGGGKGSKARKAVAR